MRVVIAGAGKVGYNLTRLLIEEKHKVTVIEIDDAHASRLSRDFPEALVIHGDATRIAHLGDAGTANCDVFVAVTGSDETNLVACQLARLEFGAPRTIARINNPKNDKVFRSLGVDTTVSGTAVIAHLIEQEATAGTLKTLLTFHHGEMAIVQVVLPSTAPVVRQKVRDLAKHLPAQSILVSIIRGSQVILPKGETVLHPNDTVLALTTLDKEHELKRTLLGRDHR